MSTTPKRYRPVLSAAIIDHILYLAKSESPISQESMTVISILAPFQAKIQNAGIAEAYSLAPPKQGLEESLGMTVPTTGGGATPPAEYLTKEQVWANAYIKYSMNPASCTLSEIKAAKEHMYLHSLMSEEEEREFEREQVDIRQAD